jgi:hypothetical protein
MTDFNGLGMSLGNLSRLSTAQTRSISAENPTGEKGRGGAAREGTGARASRDLGLGWKVSPCIRLEPGETRVLADISGAGAIQHLWITVHRNFWRSIILRFHWEDDQEPAIEVPLGDFFCQGWNAYAQVNSLPVAVNPHGGLNSYWEMPFRTRARITVESLASEAADFFYQVDYTLTSVPEDCAYLHAQWRRSNPVPYGQVHTILETVPGPGHYVGTYLAWGVNNNGWWGEGEVKFFLDGDDEFPTICGTGTEDYFGGAWNFDPGDGYREFSTPYLGLPQVIRPDGTYKSQQRFGMYRWHVMDPIRFQSDLRVTVQALGWRSGGRYLPLQDDVASTAFFYARATSLPRPQLPGADGLEVI